jgi:glutamyl-tRNA(Gln) amidotransferase subunit D
LVALINLLLDFAYSQDGLLQISVHPTGNMLPEVAYIKLGWVLGQTDDPEEVKRMMLTSVNDEITDREPYNGYLVYQGGVPEIKEFIKNHRK